MTIKDKRAYLRRYQYIDSRVNSLCEEITRWRSLAAKITPVLSDTPKGSGGGNPLQHAVERIIAQIKDWLYQPHRLTEDIIEATALLWAAFDEINKLRGSGGDHDLHT